MADRPTLHLRSAAWVNARKRADEWPPPGYSGRQYHIMRAPNGLHGEVGDGCVRVLVPVGEEARLSAELVRMRRAGIVPDDTLEAYRRALNLRWGRLAAVEPVGGGNLLGPGWLSAELVGGDPVLVADGDTLTCSCSAAESLAGRCHRAIAAPWQAHAGWRILLDDVEVIRA